MKHIHDVVELNRQSVSKSDSLAKSDFRSTNSVVIRFQMPHFSGVVDFTREKETMVKCGAQGSGSPHADSTNMVATSTPEAGDKATTYTAVSPLKLQAPGTSPAAKKSSQSPFLLRPSKRIHRPPGA
jgi:hypothetical protein